MTKYGWAIQGGTKHTLEGRLAPKASDDGHHTDGRNKSGDTPTPTLLFYSLSSLEVSTSVHLHHGKLGIPHFFALSSQDGGTNARQASGDCSSRKQEPLHCHLLQIKK